MTDNTILNGLIGAVVSFLTSFVPFSPVLGGAVAAYLEGGDRRASIRVGALAGLLVWLPLTPLLLVGLAVAPFDFGITFFLILIVLAFLGAYTVGLSALGGFLAAYLLEGRQGRGAGGTEQLTLSDDPRSRRDR